ncbi:MAG: hypothetical protein JKY65_15080, partial [Planctomycetes bacterium]|nr:hypothetical protein [Planctomycetota bacterium]
MQNPLVGWRHSRVWLAPGFDWLPVEFEDLLAAFGINESRANLFVTVGTARFYVKLRWIRPSASLRKPHLG